MAPRKRAAGSGGSAGGQDSHVEQDVDTLADVEENEELIHSESDSVKGFDAE